jgi:spore germination cell wall hydrolase CwlJ-like protein
MVRGSRHKRIFGMRWVCATVAPWALSGGLLVSFTAVAGNDFSAGYSIRHPSAVSPLIVSDALIEPGDTTFRGFAPDASTLMSSVQHAALRFHLPYAAILPDPGSPPRHEAKENADAALAIDRTAKGDPVAPVRTSLSRRGGDLPQRDGRFGFGPASSENPTPARLLRGQAMPEDTDAARRFTPWREPRTTTDIATAERSPLASSQGSTGVGRAGGSTTTRDGATPSVARANEQTAGRPRYADLVDPGAKAREAKCLAEAVYFEARSEPEAGQSAVAQVILNRVRSSLYPSTICGVVYQNRHRHLACQFTFACEGKSLRINDQASWRRAVRVSDAVLAGDTYLEKVGGATHYHADYVNPRWASRLKHKDTIGRHIFYQLRPGQR